MEKLSFTFYETHFFRLLNNKKVKEISDNVFSKLKRLACKEARLDPAEVKVYYFLKFRVTFVKHNHTTKHEKPFFQ